MLYYDQLRQTYAAQQANSLQEALTTLRLYGLPNEAAEGFWRQLDIAYFLRQGVTVKVISGDSPVTVGAVATRCGVPGADDPFDAFLLAMALVGEANYLVTGDHRAGLLQRGHFSRTRIVTPTVFCAEAL